MSCVHFYTPRQAEQMRLAQGGKLKHSSPLASTSKINRLKMLATSENPKIRASAAGNPALGAADIAILAVDPETEVRGWVARNPATSVDVLRSMLKDPDADLVSYVKYRLVGL